MHSKAESIPDNSNPVLVVSKDGTVLYSNEVSKPLLNEWDARVREKVPSNIVDLVQRVINHNSPEKMEVKAGNREYLVVFHPLPEKECVNISGYDISNQRVFDEKPHESEEKYRKIFNLIGEGIAICELVLDENGQPIDVIILEANPAYEKHDQLLNRWYTGFASRTGDEGSSRVAIVFDDITDRKKTDEALRLSNGYNRSLIEASLDPLVTIGSDGKISDVNAATEEVTGYCRNDLIGTYFSDYFTEPEKANEGYKQVFKDGKVRDYPLEIRHKDGHVTSVLYNASVYRDEKGKDIGVFAAARDITKLKKAEDELKNTLENLETLVEERTKQLDVAYNSLKESEKSLSEAQMMSHVGNWDWNILTNKICCSDELYRIFGYSPQETKADYNEFLKHHIYPDDKDNIDKLVMRALAGMPYNADFRILKKGGEKRNVHVETFIFFDENNKPIRVRGILQDITERKKTEEKLRDSEEKYRNIIETANEGIGIIDSRGIVTFANKKLWDMLGYSVDESYNKSAFDLIEDVNDFKRKIEDRRKGISDVYELKAVRKDGSKLWLLASVKPLFNEKGEYLGSLGMFTDISKRKEAEETLNKIDIARKQEIHHRIKNNLQVISSLLDLQAEQFKGKENIKESEVLDAFKESQDRVISMALIHEELYKGEGINKLNFSQYIYELARNLLLTYMIGNEGINLVTDIDEDIFFDMDTAVPLGIIINELVSNSLKHAFPGRDKGEIQIKFYIDEVRENKTERSKNKTFTLSISDNGIGIPENIDIKDLDSLGLQLLTTLVEQMDGELELKRDKGTMFIIKFTVTENLNTEFLPAVEESVSTDKTTQLTLRKFCLPDNLN